MKDAHLEMRLAIRTAAKQTSISFLTRARTNRVQIDLSPERTAVPQRWLRNDLRRPQVTSPLRGFRPRRQNRARVAENARDQDWVFIASQRLSRERVELSAIVHHSPFENETQTRARNQLRQVPRIG